MWVFKRRCHCPQQQSRPHTHIICILRLKFLFTLCLRIRETRRLEFHKFNPKSKLDMSLWRDSAWSKIRTQTMRFTRAIRFRHAWSTRQATESYRGLANHSVESSLLQSRDLLLLHKRTCDLCRKITETWLLTTFCSHSILILKIFRLIIRWFAKGNPSSKWFVVHESLGTITLGKLWDNTLDIYTTASPPTICTSLHTIGFLSLTGPTITTSAFDINSLNNL